MLDSFMFKLLVFNQQKRKRELNTEIKTQQKKSFFNKIFSKKIKIKNQ